MRTKLLVLALASCFEIAVSSASAQQPDTNAERRWGPADASPTYQPAVYGKKGPGVYTGYGRRYYGLPDYGAAMNMYGFPAPVYPPYSPHWAQPADGGTMSAGLSSTSGGTIAQPFKAGTAPDKAEFSIKVPAADAKLFFNDKLVEQQGTERKLITPALASGLTYTYRVRATWLENGQEKSQEQKLQAVPGQALNLAFGEVPAKP
ncbi:MAG TPA: TIGR03000 domain-containing protein [Gemmataceae bacterium]|jgi:uncharacterized protein (TIGR03000 family)|nr:TIGR03000 domain-containing protein [Gemmataceae bacterium]